MKFLPLFLFALSFLSLSSLVSPYSFYITFHGTKSVKDSTLPRSRPLVSVSSISHHSGVNNIYEYDSNGNLLSDSVLNGGDPLELRSVAFNSFDNSSTHDNLYVNSAVTKNSRVLLYGPCQADRTRPFLTTFISADGNIVHPYGISWGKDYNGDSSLFISSQDANTVTQYSTTGEFVKTLKDFNPDEIRGIVYDENTSNLFIADKDSGQLVAFNTIEGVVDPASNIPIIDPIAAFIDKKSRNIFVSSASGNFVSSYNLDSHTFIQNYTNSVLSHPAGVVAINGTLYVVNQDQQTVESFNVESGQYTGTFISDLPDAPEDIHINNC